MNLLIGDATEPVAEGNKIICHICNDIGKWGAGFVLALSKRWYQPEMAYKKLFRTQAINNRLELGQIKLIQVEPDIYVANMVAQFGFDFVNGQPPIRYKALQQCLNNVAVAATLLDASVHMPKIGCGIAGGDWSVIEPIITYTLESKGIPVFVYTLPDSKGSPLDNKEV